MKTSFVHPAAILQSPDNLHDAPFIADSPGVPDLCTDVKSVDSNSVTLCYLLMRKLSIGEVTTFWFQGRVLCVNLQDCIKFLWRVQLFIPLH